MEIVVRHQSFGRSCLRLRHELAICHYRGCSTNNLPTLPNIQAGSFLILVKPTLPRLKFVQDWRITSQHIRGVKSSPNSIRNCRSTGHDRNHPTSGNDPGATESALCSKTALLFLDPRRSTHNCSCDLQISLH